MPCDVIRVLKQIIGMSSRHLKFVRDVFHSLTLSTYPVFHPLTRITIHYCTALDVATVVIVVVVVVV